MPELKVKKMFNKVKEFEEDLIKTGCKHLLGRGYSM